MIGRMLADWQLIWGRGHFACFWFILLPSVCWRLSCVNVGPAVSEPGFVFTSSLVRGFLLTNFFNR